MSKPFANPFMEADLSKMFDISKFTSDFRMPQFNAEAAFSMQRKNIEAYTGMCQAAYESIQALCHRQADSFRQIVEETTQTAQAIMSSPSPEAKASKQAEISKVAVEKYLSSLRDASDTIARCNNQALETVGTRLSEGLNELRSIVKVSDRAA